MKFLPLYEIYKYRISGMSATDERRKSVDFTKPYYFSENLFIRKKGSDVNKDNLKDKKISAQVGTLQEEAAKNITTQSIPAENVSSAIMSLNTALRNNSQHKFARGKNAFCKNSYEFLIFKF